VQIDSRGVAGDDLIVTEQVFYEALHGNSSVSKTKLQASPRHPPGPLGSYDHLKQLA